MARVKRAVHARKKRKKVMDMASGYYGQKSRSYRKAKEQLLKSLSYSYRDRRQKKREFRRLWIVRINAACREYGISYSQFIHGLKQADVEIDRKMLADLAVNDTEAFAALVEKARESLNRAANQ